MKLLSLVVTVFAISVSLSARAYMGTGITLKADRVARNAKTKSLILNGHAVVTQYGHKLIADKIELNPKSGLVQASGHCHFHDQKRTLTAMNMSFKVDGGQWKLVK